MASAANDSSKRRRLLNEASPDASCLSDLPSGILTNVANYLAPPSRALFAAALTTHQNSAASNERNSAIVGNAWTALDFGDIEKELVVKLNDGDIEKVLQCIDAANRVKKLKLTNCIHITGAGLEPLRGSVIIEQIDLSLVGDHQDPQLRPKPPISREFVLPILDSIIESEGCSLRHLQFPSVWRGGRVIVRGFEQILRRYNEILVNQGVSCLKCNVNLPPENESWGCSCYGSQKYTCYECLKYYCEVCTDDDDEYMLSYCLLCERRLCVECQKKKWCNGCEGDICMDCTDYFTDCSGCGAGLCKDCCEGNESNKCCKCEGHFCETNCENQIYFRCNNCEMYICRNCDEEYDWPCCSFCDKCFCNECNENKGMKATKICDGCDTSYCGDCRVSSMCQDFGETEDCTGCFQLAGPLLLEEVMKVQKEHAEVKTENGTLKDANGYKQDHINYLKEQLQYQKEQVKELEEKMKQLESGEDG